MNNFSTHHYAEMDSEAGYIYPMDDGGIFAIHTHPTIEAFFFAHHPASASLWEVRRRFRSMTPRLEELCMYNDT